MLNIQYRNTVQNVGLILLNQCVNISITLLFMLQSILLASIELVSYYTVDIRL